MSKIGSGIFIPRIARFYCTIVYIHSAGYNQVIMEVIMTSSFMFSIYIGSPIAL